MWKILGILKTNWVKTKAVRYVSYIRLKKLWPNDLDEYSRDWLSIKSYLLSSRTF